MPQKVRNGCRAETRPEPATECRGGLLDPAQAFESIQGLGAGCSSLLQAFDPQGKQRSGVRGCGHEVYFALRSLWSPKPLKFREISLLTGDIARNDIRINPLKGESLIGKTYINIEILESPHEP